MKTNVFKTTAKVLSTQYKNTSYYGNPSYWVTFVHNGDLITGYTANNAACGYGCSNYNGKLCAITYHYTRKGNVIIDYMTKPE